MNKYEQIKGMANPNRGSVGVQEARPPQTQEPWCMKMNDCKTKCEDCPDEPPQRTEQNFCSRCGKRTTDLTTIHTCTPPQENT